MGQVVWVRDFPLKAKGDSGSADAGGLVSTFGGGKEGGEDKGGGEGPLAKQPVRVLKQLVREGFGEGALNKLLEKPQLVAKAEEARALLSNKAGQGQGEGEFGKDLEDFVSALLKSNRDLEEVHLPTILVPPTPLPLSHTNAYRLTAPPLPCAALEGPAPQV